MLGGILVGEKREVLAHAGERAEEREGHVCNEYDRKEAHSNNYMTVVR